MILAYWCVLIAALMPIGFVAYAKFAGNKKMDFEQNRHPRRWLEQTEGAQQRAYWAQLNSFEAFPPFAAGVIIAVISGGSIGAINFFAVLFILLRLVYGWCYISDRATLRSLVWGGAAACTVALFIVAAIG
ncbi:MAPEG family protein [Endozoicomonas sp. G2_2]|nr:hypothetical protein [Salinisphaera sp.]MBO9470660.1 MAPEG family protein [Endozoicomonas sp. G2_2]|tara:strand:+ start:73 stop:465 length:393 start_codon:yes stop_codon:yes gene_type:complete